MVSLDGGSADIIDDKPLLLVVHDYRYDVEDRADWTFTVWIVESFHRLFNRPKGGTWPNHPHYRQPVPPPRIDVYVGGKGPIVWAAVKVPANVRVIDKRLTAAPEDVMDGGVVRGRLFDMATHQVIVGADVVLMKLRGPKGTVRTESDESGAFRVQGIPEGYYAIHVEAEGYAGRNMGPYDNRSGHSFHDLDALLASAHSLRGQVVDTHGKPVRGVKVRAERVWGIDGFGYKCSQEPLATTDESGHFELHSLPQGFTSLRCRAPSLHQKSINSDMLTVGAKPWEKQEEASIVVEGTGTVRGKVIDDDGNPPKRPFIAEIEPKDGLKVGAWSGSGQCKEDGSFEFQDVPPGDYVVITMPNPMSEREASEPQHVTVKAGGMVRLEIVNHSANSER